MRGWTPGRPSYGKPSCRILPAPDSLGHTPRKLPVALTVWAYGNLPLHRTSNTGIIPYIHRFFNIFSPFAREIYVEFHVFSSFIFVHHVHKRGFGIHFSRKTFIYIIYILCSLRRLWRNIMASAKNVRLSPYKRRECFILSVAVTSL